jgi:hypothetical protein
MFVAQSYGIALILFRVAEFAAHEGIYVMNVDDTLIIQIEL